MMIESLEGLSNLYEKTGQLNKALEHDRQALELKLDPRTEWNDGADQKRQQARSYYNIGSIYYKKKDYMKAFEYIHESYRIRDILYSNKNHPELFLSLNALANIYETVGDYPKADHFGRMADFMYQDLKEGNQVRRVDFNNFDFDRYELKPPKNEHEDITTMRPVISSRPFISSSRPAAVPVVLPPLERSTTFTDKIQGDDL